MTKLTRAVHTYTNLFDESFIIVLMSESFLIILYHHIPNATAMQSNHQNENRSHRPQTGAVYTGLR
jgi:hypothetical protein